MSHSDRIFEDIKEYLREEYPSFSEEDIETIANIIYKAWCDGIL